MENQPFIIAMLAPSLLISLGVLVYPLLNTVVQSFKSPDTGKYTLKNYVYLFTDEISTASIVYTFWITVVTVIVTIAISYLLALYLRFTDNKVSKFIGTIYLFTQIHPQFGRRLCHDDYHSRFGIVEQNITLIWR